MERKITLSHQASTIFAKCDETGEFLLGQYDPGYPGKNRHWIGRVKLLGGNYFYGKNSDKSPWETVSREIKEEFSGSKAAAEEMSFSQEHRFASLTDIELVRNALLNAVPMQDYLIDQPDPKEESRSYCIQSVFKASIPRKVMGVVEYNLSQKKSLINEGVLSIKTLDELVAGSPLTQGITGLIIGYNEGAVLPHCFKDLYTFAPIGKPREGYEAYSDIFQYKDHSKK